MSPDTQDGLWAAFGVMGDVWGERFTIKMGPPLGGFGSS